MKEPIHTDPTEVFFSVDVETAGPNPGTYALLSIGACAALNTSRTFYTELQPDKSAFTLEALAITGLSLQRLIETGRPPEDAMRSFAAWIGDIAPEGTAPVCVAFNAPFDWMFLNDYFHRYLGHNPFGHNSLDIKALYMGLRRLPTFRGTKYSMNHDFPPARPLTHNALQDAIDQAKLFQQIYAELNHQNGAGPHEHRS